jgi:hypothetical protein
MQAERFGFSSQNLAVTRLLFCHSREQIESTQHRIKQKQKGGGRFFLYRTIIMQLSCIVGAVALI